MTSTAIHTPLLHHLPPECITNIIRFLLPTDIASLLRVNKLLASLALPYLYNDPFQSQVHGNNVRYENDRLSVTRLLRLLVANVVSNNIYGCSSGAAGITSAQYKLHEAVNVAYVLAKYRIDEDEDEDDFNDSDNEYDDDHRQSNIQERTPVVVTTTSVTTTANAFNYLAHVRHLNLGRWAGVIPTFARYFYPPLAPAPILALVTSSAFQAACKVDRLLSIHTTENRSAGGYEFFVAFRVILLREVIWTLAYPILEQLQSLTIPVSDIKRYIGVVDRLQYLERACLHLDELFDTFPYDYEQDNYDDPAVMETWRRTRERKEEDMRDILQFFDMHTRLFPGRLKYIDCPETFTWPGALQTLPDKVFAKLVSYLPAIRSPTVVNELNWVHFMATHASADLSFLREIDVSRILGAPVRKQLLENRDLLRRSRALEKIAIGSLGPGGFQWAVEEKRASLSKAEGQGSVLCDVVDRKQVGLAHVQDEVNEDRYMLLRHNGLVPLKEIVISDSTSLPFTDDDIDDLAFSFSSTLQVFLVLSYYDTSSSLRSLRIGHRWMELPLLTELDISFGNTRLLFDAGILVHCPNIVTLTLRDWTFEYQPQDLQDASTGMLIPAELPRLERCHIAGWTALRLHPATLHSTSNLKMLTIAMITRDNDQCYIPPPSNTNANNNSNNNNNDDDDDDYDHDQLCISSRWSHWTWDWDLPRLTRLDLNAEFAFNFQFRMLAKCPALEELCLNIYTLHPESYHVRTITMSDLFLLPARESESESESMSQLELENQQQQQGRRTRIVARSLKSLEMRGTWAIESPQTNLPDFLVGTFPNLLHLKVAYWTSIPISAFLDILRIHSSPAFAPKDLSFDERALGRSPAEGEEGEEEVWKEREIERVGLLPHGTDCKGRGVLPTFVSVGLASYQVLKDPHESEREA